MKVNQDRKIFDSSFWWAIGPLLIFILIVFSFPIIFTSTSIFGLDFTNTGQIGDTIGGIMLPFIAIVAAILTFIAFWVQYKANLLHRDDINHERFERKYYELLRLHRENVNEMDIAGIIKGRKCFLHMFNEYKAVYWSLKSQNHSQDHFNYSEEKIIDLSYLLFFHGIGVESNNSILNVFEKDDHGIIENTREYLRNIQSHFEKAINSRHITFYEHNIPTDQDTDFTLRLPYYPFDGHSTRLGHYYRHLFQSVKFVVHESKNLLKYEDTLLYLKSLRAQLSNYEQLLLYFNSFSKYGKEWDKNRYLTKYRMIHNLPLAQVDFGISPEERFKEEIEQLRANGKELFEWHER